MKRTKKAMAFGTAAAMTVISTVTAFAAYTSGDNGDGFSLGHYVEEENTEEKAKTQAMYDARPVNLRQMEYLTRGLTAVPSDDGVLISWRFLGTDSQALQYNLYRDGIKINAEPLSLTNFFDELGKPGAVYTLAEVINGEENGISATASAWDKEYVSFDLQDLGEDYIIDDGAVGDLDGDGEYEYLFRRTPKNMDTSTRTVYPLIEAYDNDGKYMWTINMGPNEINEVDINMMVYDMDGDGRAELMLRSFEGTIDGKGNTIGDTNNDGITDYSKNPNNLAIFKDRQYIISTPEFVSLYKGETGEEIARTDMLPAREPLSEWSYNYTDTGRLTKRASHFLWGIAYLDGATPSLVNVRGAWDNVRVAAWHIENDQFKEDWQLLTPNKEDLNSIWGAVNHNIGVADIDFDGKDEIFSGPMAVDHDGTAMYATKTTDNDGKQQKLGHGDAFDMAKMDPDYDGYLSWACHETSPLLANIELHDGRTGQVLWGYGKNKDTGRSRAADIDPNYRGFEVWGSTGTIPMNISGEQIADNWNQFKYRLPDGTYEKDDKGKDVTGTLPMNFKVYWDGDLLSEFLDGTRVSKWDYDNKEIAVLFDAEGCMSNGGTKAVPCLSADLFGDWREEIIWKTSDEKSIRIYSTNIETPYKIPTLMHDSTYRASIAMQNNHYNQPPNVSYYLGAETTEVPIPEIFVEYNGEKLTNPDLNNTHASYPVLPKESESAPMRPLGAAKVIKLFVGSPYVYVDDDITKVDTNDDEVVPMIVDDRTLVPVRFVSENFGLTVGWDDASRKISISGRGHNIEMTLDSASYTVNGEERILDVPATSYNGRTMIPLRAMSEAIGRKVFWDEKGLIVISKQEFTDTASIDSIIDSLKSGKKPEPTPVPATPEPTSTPDPLVNMEYTDYKDDSGIEWKIYLNEDFSSYELGDKGGFEGTKPAPLDTIKVINSDGNKAIQIGGSSKGNRNAIYHLPAPMSGKSIVELDWKTGAMTGGSSTGELRFADSSDNVFLAFSVQDGRAMQYSYGGKISNGGLETAEWKVVDSSFDSDTKYHITIIADFDSKKVSFKVSNGSKTAEIKDMEFTNGDDFSALEVLAVRQESNFNWMTELSNIKAGIAK